MIAAMLRVKNEARWIGRVIDSIRPLCNPIIVLDDHSDDGTQRICREHECIVIDSPFDGLDESRDKEYLLRKALDFDPEYVLCIDGDEILEPNGPQKIRAAIQDNPNHVSFSLRVLYLWNSYTDIRTDGVYGRFSRPSLCKVMDCIHFAGTGNGGNFHCGNVPRNLRGPITKLDVALLHTGYMLREDRIRKYEWYNHQDPGNVVEDGYKHVVIDHVPWILVVVPLVLSDSVPAEHVARV